MTSITELLASYRAGTLPLSALFEALTARGALSEAQYHSELEQLEGLRATGELNPEILRALLAKLAALQAAPPIDLNATLARPIQAQRSSPDATVVTARAAPLLPADDDATVVKPPAGSSVRPGLGKGDATVLRTPTIIPPPKSPSAADDATVVKSPTVIPPPAGNAQASAGTGTQSGTGTASGVSSSQASWQRIAGVVSSDYVTVGSVLKGRFHLEKEIGRGGMGVVFMARDERKVEARDRDPYLAIKVLNDEFRQHPDSLIALQRESRRSQQLAHENIVRVFDFDKDGTIVFMTMEYIDGSDLKGLIRDRAFNGLPLKEARPLIEGMARGLARAHADGVVHSDFKPGNVMVTRAGVPKVFDFGIARAGKHAGDAKGEVSVFDAATLGALTPAYASLEMIQGKEPEPSDDIYALGCVVFELLTGKHPFDKVSAEVAMKEGRKPPPVKGLTKRQYKTLLASIAFTRNQRLKSAGELVEGLRDLSASERARPYLLYGLPALIAVAAGGWGYAGYRHSHELSDLIARFAVERPGHFADEDEARRALDALSDEDRKRIIGDRGELIEAFLRARVDGYWKPGAKHYDYAKAQHIFQLREQLKLYSPKLDTLRAEVEQQKNSLLNTLDTQLTAQIDANNIFDAQPENAAATMALIRTIDPGSALLKNAQLELKYDNAIGKLLTDGKLDEARQRMLIASQVFADSARLKLRQGQIKQLDQTFAAQQKQEKDAQQAARAHDQLIKAVADAITVAANTDDWRAKAKDSYLSAQKALGADAGLQTEAVRFKQILAAQVKQTEASDLNAAARIATFAVELFPDDSALAAARQSVVDQQGRVAQEAQTKTQRIEQARSRVAGLVANPLGTAVWLQDIKTALSDARSQIGADTPAYADARGSVDDSVVKLARSRLASGDLDDAERIARAGQQIDAAEPQLAKVLAEVAQARTLAQSKQTQQQVAKLADARKALAGLSAKPTFTGDWQKAVTGALDLMRNDPAPETRRLIDGLADAIAAEAGRLSTTPQQLPQARFALDFGLKLLPKSAALLAQHSSIDKLQRDTQAKLDQDSAEATVKDAIVSLKTAAATGDVKKSAELIERIRKLRPNDPFLQVEGPKLLSDAYLRVAEEAFQNRSYQNAVDLIARGLKTLGERPELRSVKARYELVAGIKKADNKPLAAADYEHLKKLLDEIRRADPTALNKLEADLKARGQLSTKTLTDQLERLKPSAVPKPTITEPVAPATPGNTQPPPSTSKPEGTPAAVPQTSTKTEPAAPPKPTTKPETQAPSGSPTAADPCNRPELIGAGKSCNDAFGERKGPKLVVVPGLDGGKPYALSRAEVSIYSFNDFCNATGKCGARAASDADFGNAPISNIPFALAEAYTGWLSSVSGYTYRLPTDAEWTHAAKAGGGWKQAEDSNCVLPSATGGGVGAAVSPKGREANPWGLVHMTGNVWEWVSSHAVRGGSFSENWSDCTVNAKHDDNGQAKPDVGFRVLRELK